MSYYLMEMTGSERELLLGLLSSSQQTPNAVQLRDDLEGLVPNQGFVISGPEDLDPNLLTICSSRVEAIPIAYVANGTRARVATKVDQPWVRHVMCAVEVERYIDELAGKLLPHLSALQADAGGPAPNVQSILALLQQMEGYVRVAYQGVAACGEG